MEPPCLEAAYLWLFICTFYTQLYLHSRHSKITKYCSKNEQQGTSCHYHVLLASLSDPFACWKQQNVELYRSLIDPGKADLMLFNILIWDEIQQKLQGHILGLLYNNKYSAAAV